ncbi:hypothetical protein GMA19_01491 [Paenibacillus polymyxa E681]|nr:hypothetical protein GE561_01491 [Paenibacillus polymyxa E681]QNV61167.1 hypothetical protein GMA19_01491 [Paenibacillus polymyxa E681]
MKSSGLNFKYITVEKYNEAVSSIQKKSKIPLIERGIGHIKNMIYIIVSAIKVNFIFDQNGIRCDRIR